jgi:hypothetical protein
MANAVLKYRPLVPKDSAVEGIENNEVNEYLAAYHGIIVCANFQNDGNQTKGSLLLQRYMDTKPKYCHRPNARMYMRVRGGGAAPCSDVTRALPSPNCAQWGLIIPKYFFKKSKS